jgi:RND family efflux transporter MFP subunit
MKQHKTGIIALIASVTFLWSCTDHEGSVAVETDPVKVTISRPAKKSTQRIHVSGRVESDHTAVISTRIMGFITSVKVKAGDKVTRGQLLATISNGDVLAKQAQAKAMVSEADAALRDAEKDYQRYQDLFAKQSASAKELENITLRYESMKAKKEAAQQIVREAETMLTYTNLTAPFTGVVAQKLADAGSMANPGMPLLIIEQKGNFQVSATLSESEVSMVKQGAIAEVTVKSTGAQAKGTVSEISPSATNTGRYSIKIAIDGNTTERLMAGMVTNVSIESTDVSTDDVITVPLTALVIKDQLTGIYTVSDGGKAMLRWIKPGRSFGEEVEVLSGINENETFIASAQGKLHNGIPVATTN